MPAIFPRRRCKAMHEKRVMDFNPLNLLATAAALQSSNSKHSKENSKNSNTVAKKNKKNKETKPSSNPEVCVITKQDVASDSNIDKMLDEHNYGNAKRSMRSDDNVRRTRSYSQKLINKNHNVNDDKDSSQSSKVNIGSVESGSQTTDQDLDIDVENTDDPIEGSVKSSLVNTSVNEINEPKKDCSKNSNDSNNSSRDRIELEIIEESSVCDSHSSLLHREDDHRSSVKQGCKQDVSNIVDDLQQATWHTCKVADKTNTAQVNNTPRSAPISTTDQSEVVDSADKQCSTHQSYIVGSEQCAINKVTNTEEEKAVQCVTDDIVGNELNRNSTCLLVKPSDCKDVTANAKQAVTEPIDEISERCDTTAVCLKVENCGDSPSPVAHCDSSSSAHPDLVPAHSKGDHSKNTDSLPNEYIIMRSLLTGQKEILENRPYEFLGKAQPCIDVTDIAKTSCQNVCINEESIRSNSVDCDNRDSLLKSSTVVAKTNYSLESVSHFEALSSGVKDSKFSAKTEHFQMVSDNSPNMNVMGINPSSTVSMENVKPVAGQPSDCGDIEDDQHIVVDDLQKGVMSPSCLTTGVCVSDDHCYAGSTSTPRNSMEDSIDTDTEMSSQEDNATTSTNLLSSQLSEDSGLCLSSPCDDSSFSELGSQSRERDASSTSQITSLSQTMTLTSPQKSDMVITPSPITISPFSIESPNKDLNMNTLETSKDKLVGVPVVIQDSSTNTSSSISQIPETLTGFLINSPDKKGTPLFLATSPVKLNVTPPRNITPTKSPSSVLEALRTPRKSPSLSPGSSSLTSPKIGSFRIGALGSLSNSALTDEESNDGIQTLKTPPKLKIPTSPDLTDKSKNGKTLPLSWKNSLLHANLIKNSKPMVTCFETGVLPGHISHDHDYCSRVANRNIVQPGDHPLLSPVSPNSSTVITSVTSSSGSQTKLIVDTSMAANRGTARTRAKMLIQASEADPLDNAPKMRITGSYQNQYVYYLNKKSRRRRRTSQGQDVSVLVDKKRLHNGTGIIVPHLSDADLEALKQGKTLPSLNANTTAASLNACSVPLNDESEMLPTSSSSNAVSDPITDEKIINTILSLEDGDSNDEPPTPIPSDMSSDFVAPSDDNLGLSLNPEQMNLTPEEMELLYNAVDEVKKTMTIEDADDSHVDGIDESSESSICGSPAVESLDKDFPIPKTEPNLPKDLFDLKSENPGLCENTFPVSSDILPRSSDSLVVGESKPLDMLPTQDLSLHKDDIESNSTSQKPSQPAAGDVLVDDSAPWIVTVNMFWNDLPALIYNNQPYIRLVDIHKQILPAKDTGILKKRCQLLDIDVKNCTEMQRYFLVQYGKAVSSKSTLIISKDDAKTLISYYVNPIPRPPRLPDGSISKLTTVVNTTKIDTPIVTSEIQSKKQMKERISSDLKVVNSLMDSVSSAPPVLPTRTRHKKINFLEMLKGESSGYDPDDPLARDNEIDVSETHESSKVKKDKSANRVIEFSSRKSLSPTTTETVIKICDKKDSVKSVLRSDPGNEKSEFSGVIKIRRDSKCKKDEAVKETSVMKLKTQANPTSLRVVHKYTNATNGHRSKTQLGLLMLHVFKNLNSLCVQCETCEQMLSVSGFKKHLHDGSRQQKLISINDERTLEPFNSELSDFEKRLWTFYVKKDSLYKELVNNKPKKKPQQKIVRVRPEIVRKLRESPRKRKRKQLYPIEDFSYAKRRHIDGDDKRDVSHSNIVTSSDAENVVTVQNTVPEVTSYTALDDLF